MDCSLAGVSSGAVTQAQGCWHVSIHPPCLGLNETPERGDRPAAIALHACHRCLLCDGRRRGKTSACDGLVRVS